MVRRFQAEWIQLCQLYYNNIVKNFLHSENYDPTIMPLLPASGDPMEGLHPPTCVRGSEYVLADDNIVTDSSPRNVYTASTAVRQQVLKSDH